MKLKKVYSIIAMALIVFQCLLITPENIFAIDNLDGVENESLNIDAKLKPILSKNIISINEVADVAFECNMDVSYPTGWT